MRASSSEWVTDTIELVSPVAEGAMGSVWVAYHHRLHTRVAIKFVSTKLQDSTHEALIRFEREASTASQIKSRHVVRVFDSGVSSAGVPYIVMELLDGESLGHRLRTRGPLSLLEATYVIMQVARGLTKAHELGIVHRDIKPDNIFLCRFDSTQTTSSHPFECKILDFGIAKQTRLPAMGGLTTEGKLVGTPEYMSPEQVLEDTPVTYRADLWALAVVMYTSLTGELPFKGKTLGQLCINLVSRKPAAPSALVRCLEAQGPRGRRSLGPAVDTWFARALSRDVAERFASATEMAKSFAVLQETHAGDVSHHGGEDTERNFGSTADRPLASERRRAPRAIGGVVWAATALGVVALGSSAVAFSQKKAPAAQTLKPMVTQAATAVLVEVQARNGSVPDADLPATTIDLDEASSSREGAIERTQGGRRASTRAAPSGGRAPADPEAATPDGADEAKPNRRGKAELGF